MVEEMEWININLFEPNPGVPIIVKTPYGIREAVHSADIWGPRYRFTDVTHPAGNINLSKYDIQGWKFARKEDAESLNLTKNHWQLQKDGDEILAGIKPETKSFFQKLLSKFKLND